MTREISLINGSLFTEQNDLEDALRLEATFDDINNSQEGMALVRWLRKRHRIMKKIFRLLRRIYK